MADASSSIKPTVLFNTDNRIFLELPPGKIGKDGTRTIQKGQKGSTSAFYAMKRLLTTEQIRSEHGKTCSLRRKMISVEGTEFLSLQKYFIARHVANKLFFTKKNLTPEKEASTFWLETLIQPLAPMERSFIVDMVTHSKNTLDRVKPWYALEHLEAAADRLMARDHGLEEVPCKDLITIQAMIKTLREKGPLMITGLLGKQLYAGQEPAKLDEKVGTHSLYGWKKGTPTSEEMKIAQMIVLIGAEVKNGKEYIYWISPEDANDPANPDSQRVYVSSFESIVTHMTTLAGVPMFMITTPESRAIIGGALYNPAFTSG